MGKNYKCTRERNKKRTKIVADEKRTSQLCSLIIIIDVYKNGLIYREINSIGGFHSRGTYLGQSVHNTYISSSIKFYFFPYYVVGVLSEKKKKAHKEKGRVICIR